MATDNNNVEIRWEIHYQLKGRPDKERVYYTRYKRKGYAWRMAKKLFGQTKKYHYWLVGRPVKPTSSDGDIIERFCDMF